LLAAVAPLSAQTYTFSTLAGLAGSPGSINGTGSAARFSNPVGLAVDSAGNVYVAEWVNHSIRKITSAGGVTTLAGPAGFVPVVSGSADGTGSTARFSSPFDVEVDTAGNAYVADYNNQTIRKITSAGVVTTLAGTAGLSGWVDATGSAARFNQPFGVAVDSSGNVYVGEYNQTIRKITTNAVVTTLAGSGSELVVGSTDGTGSVARFNYPERVAVDSAGNVYIADKVNHTIRKMTSGGTVTTLAGAAGVPGSADGTATAARFNLPVGITVDGSGNIFVADTSNYTIRKITNGLVSTVAGLVGSPGSADGAGSAARFSNVYGVAVDSAGNLYVSDYGNHTIRKGVPGSTAVPPSITIQPVSTTTNLGGNATFTVGYSGTPTPTNQWRKDGVAITGATSPNFTIVGATANDTATYTAVVTNAAGSVTSNPATLTVYIPPAITTQPTNVAVSVGQSATFTVVATGVPTPGYQWRKEGIAIAGATGSSFTIGSTATTDAGNYSVVVSSNAGTVISNNATLSVGSLPPVITTQPANVIVNVGQPATFSVIATGTAPLSYQWQKGGSAILGATGSIFVIGSTVAGDSGNYSVLVSNSVNSVSSNVATLTVIFTLPVITTQPASVAVNAGQPASFSVIATSTSPLTYQWRKDGTAIAGATASSFSIGSTAASDSGSYSVVVTNGAGPITSNSATLTVGSVIPVISSQPSGGTFRLGQSASLAVVATGTGPLQYRWFKDGVAVASGTGSTLNIASLQESDAGGYYVEVSGPGGKAASQNVVLVVQSPPRFVVQPLNATVEKGLNTSFSAVVAGSPTPTLQWYSRIGSAPFQPLTNGGNYSGTNGSVLRVSSVDTASDGMQFQVRATNAAGVTESEIKTLRVAQPNTALKIKTQPQSVIVKAGDTGVFTVELEGSTPATFQWLKDGVILPPATTTVCRRPGLAENEAGYSVVIRDANGGIVTSNTASLTVVGAVDTSFDPKGGPNGPVRAMIALSDGGYLSGGAFTRVAGLPRAGLARFRRDGTVVADFDPGTGPNGDVRALVELAGSKFLVVGQFDRFNGAVVPGVVRLDAQGRVDSSFNPVLPAPPANDSIPLLERFHFIAIGMSGGGYLLGGQAGIVALTPSGATVPSSVFNTNGPVFALLQQFNGGFIVGGDFTSFGGSSRPRLARLTSDFRLDTGFDVGTGPNAAVESLLRSPDGWIYVFGRFNGFNGAPRLAGLARISPTGRPDESFNPPLGTVPRAASVDPSSASEKTRLAGGRLEANNGIILPYGGVVPPPSVTNTSGTQKLAAVSPSGAVSNTFDVSVNGPVNALAVSSDEAVTVAGNFSSISGTDRPNVGVITDDTAGSRVVNLSTRGRVSGGDRNLFLGFVVKGSESMRVLIRGVGPTLRAFGITSPLTRPQLTVYDSANAIVSENRGWRTTADPDGLAQIMKQVGAFDLSSADDTAMVLNLAPGNYTAQISGQSEGQGTALGEVYAVDHGNSRLINLSVRGAVGTGDDVLIPAFVVTGGPRLLLMRTIGPGLVQFGVPGTLSRPSMELRNSTAVLQTNQGWTSSFDPAALQARTPLVGAFPLSAQSADAAVLTALDAGAYTVTAKGADGGTGIALVEIYDANGVERPEPSP
jgi:hypothetical protein